MRTGFIAIGHNDYTGSMALSKTTEAVERLRANGVKVHFDGKIHTDIRETGEYSRSLVAENVSSIILFPSTWIECPVAMAAVTEFEHLPFALWGMGMFEHGGRMESTGSLVSYAMLEGAFKKMEYSHSAFYGDPGDEGLIKVITAFVRAADAVYRLKRSLIGLVGYSSMGIYTGMFDAPMLRKKIGPEVIQTDSYTVVNMMNSVSGEELALAAGNLFETAVPDEDIADESIQKLLRMYCALKKLCKDGGYEAINVKCQYEFSKELGMTACVPLSLLAEEGIVAACEGDIPCSVSMLALKYLSGGIPAYADVIDVDGGGVVKLSPCGFIPYSLGTGIRRIRGFMPGYGFNGVQNSFPFKGGKITYLRIAEMMDGYEFIYGTGEGTETELRQGYMPALDVRPDGDAGEFVRNFYGQHYAFCYGDFTREIAELEKIYSK
ncbi:MAG: hypothetical protein JXB33_11005 [Clostridia bacterium]|nr:hypothetical protein [Clostridia bacterium]